LLGAFIGFQITDNKGGAYFIALVAALISFVVVRYYVDNLKSLVSDDQDAKKPQHVKKDPRLDFALGKENYILLIIGFLIIILGFALMVGGKAEDPNEFNPEIFSFRRITLAPIIVLFGFIFEIWAIMKKPKTS